MEFCPTCGSLIQFELSCSGRPAGFFCRLCPYVCQIGEKAKIKRGVKLDKKEVEFTVAKKIEGPTTDATCPKCGHGRATYRQQQTRSSDEPMTIFYECLNKACVHKWCEN